MEVAKVVRTKTSEQVYGHARGYFQRLEKEGKGHLIPPKLDNYGRPRKVCTEEAHQQQQGPTLSSASTSSDTICTTGDQDDSTSDIESAPPASIFMEEDRGGSVEEVCDGAAPAPPAVGTGDLELDAIARQMYEDLLHFVQSQRQSQPGAMERVQ